MSDFGYSDDPFQDYSWFRNCIDNSNGSSSGGSGGYSPNDPNHPVNKVGGLIAAVLWIFLLVLMIGDSFTDNAFSLFILHLFGG